MATDKRGGQLQLKIARGTQNNGQWRGGWCKKRLTKSLQKDFKRNGWRKAEECRLTRRHIIFLKTFPHLPPFVIHLIATRRSRFAFCPSTFRCVALFSGRQSKGGKGRALLFVVLIALLSLAVAFIGSKIIFAARNLFFTVLPEMRVGQAVMWCPSCWRLWNEQGESEHSRGIAGQPTCFEFSRRLTKFDNKVAVLWPNNNSIPPKPRRLFYIELRFSLEYWTKNFYFLICFFVFRLSLGFSFLKDSFVFSPCAQVGKF